MIPRIIHQIAPRDPNKWPAIWKPCRESWQERFPDFEHRLWDDDDDLTNFIETHYPDYAPAFKRMPTLIMQLDFIRYVILYHYGGIYADMDMYCYQNFYNALDPQKVYIVELDGSDYPVENSLMIAPKNHPFFYRCLSQAHERFIKLERTHPSALNRLRDFQSPNPQESHPTLPYSVMNTVSVKFLYEMYQQSQGDVELLPCSLFNRKDHSYDPSYRTKHVSTRLWSKDGQYIPHDPEYYDFYKDYTNAQKTRTQQTHRSTTKKKRKRSVGRYK